MACLSDLNGITCSSNGVSRDAICQVGKAKLQRAGEVPETEYGPSSGAVKRSNVRDCEAQLLNPSQARTVALQFPCCNNANEIAPRMRCRESSEIVLPD
jgi:hypothetical protein